ncbi:MAG: hypothetical protein C4576_31775 [Desulfobacteraceae bacterium]|nr:MAG: hypothetical protein C4576_31775 [Desulfobacteraceae bacterium]
MKKTKKPPKVKPVVKAAVTDGSEWLAQLSEDVFRGEILLELFNRMQKTKSILGSKYVHGPNEHGIDWIVVDKGGLSSRYIGIQCKSKRVTRQGDSRSDSALQVKLQCEMAYDYLFEYDGAQIRLDSVELWMSNHITSDAEEDFSAPLNRKKITVRRSPYVFSLLEEYCPRIIQRIPGLAISGFLKKQCEPEPLPIKILGCNLNPKFNFIEPQFSKNPELSPARLFQKKYGKVSREKLSTLDDILSIASHIMIVGHELSGKTYILQRAAYLLAESGVIPILETGESIAQKGVKNICKLINRHLDWLTLKDIETPEILNRSIAVLIDNADKLNEGQLANLAESCHQGIRIICTSKKDLQISKFLTFYIAGVNFSSINGFIRSLDVQTPVGPTFTDRATSFIYRTIATSGLPVNPFTVSAMLRECAFSKKKFATPTMGRLIERFIEDQLGSHTDTALVDFETKRQFLTDLGGKNYAIFEYGHLRKYGSKFLASKGHPHTLDDFIFDLCASGLIKFDGQGESYSWTHRIFQEFFWVRNLVRENRLGPILKRLSENAAPSVAAITGSQIGNPHTLVKDLLQRLEPQSWMKESKQVGSEMIQSTEGDICLPTDSAEEEILAKIESDALNNKEDSPLVPAEESEGRSDDTIRSASSVVSKIAEEKHFVSINLSALLVNSRDLSIDDKAKVVTSILRSNGRMSTLFDEILVDLAGGKLKPLVRRFLCIYWHFVMNDLMLGDGFLVEVFRSLSRGCRDHFERLALTDLLVACCDDEPEKYIDSLVEINRLDAAVAVYTRIVSFYYFRFHRSEDKTKLKNTLREIRKLAPGYSLPKVS